ncbi:CaiB/BaiF CoA-transferase family protein [Williamsia muralis]|uniref:CaiB/BaiF CoA-transferase family protein n=1 Tax=Williamsia marianensis TaxID=85044 RepID=UPI00117BF8CF|nr:CoA transferase [Williamsia marianensis]
MTTSEGSPGGRSASLRGIRVLDVTRGVAGPVATMLLADLGAEVIRVEIPRVPSDSPELPGSVMWHRNKRICVEGPDSPIVADLVAGADIIVTTSSDVADALGLCEHTVSGGLQNHQIHVSMPPIAGSDKLDGQTIDALAAAFSGVARRQSSFDGGPVESVYPFLSYMQGLWAATTTIAALIERERSARGQTITVDGMHGVLVAATTTMVVDPAGSSPITSVGAGGPNPTYTTYRCADGEWLFLGALTEKFQSTAFALLGCSDILDDARIAGDREKLYSPQHRGWVRERLAAGFACRDRSEWLELLAVNDCPASAVGQRDQWLSHPQVLALNQRRSVRDPLVGVTTMPFSPVDLSETPVRDPRPRSFTSSHRWIGAAWQPGTSTSTDLLADGDSGAAEGPLAGTKVLDLGTVLAGPYAGMLLAELGADVVKVEPPSGDAFRVRGYPHYRGQRSLALDLRDDGGYKAFQSLVEHSGVVIDNFRPGVLKRLAIERESLMSVRPDVITVSITGFGDVGPLGGRPGFDPVLQAMSGMMAAQGGDDHPVFSTIAVNDVAAACVTALGTCAALFHRVRGGGGQQVTTTLAAVTSFMQSGELVEFAGRQPSPTGGRDHRGSAALSRYYPTSDGYVRIHVDNVRDLISAGLLATEPPLEELTNVIANALCQWESAAVVGQIGAVGGFAVAARTFRDLLDDRVVADNEYLQSVVWPDGRTTFLPGRYAHFSRSQRAGVMTPPGLGEHSEEVLAECGVSGDRFEELVRRNAVVSEGPIPSVADVGYR